MYHRDLDVWKKSIELVKEIYAITANFPNSELYGLVNQIPDNETLRFIDISLGSLAELETQSIIACELG